ncbi:MAG: hypothetical protein AB8B55_18780 [Mariniblastus sp.]
MPQPSPTLSNQYPKRLAVKCFCLKGILTVSVVVWSSLGLLLPQANAQVELEVPKLAGPTESPNDLAPHSTWQPATQLEITNAFTVWLEESETDESISKRVKTFVAEETSSSKSEVVDKVIDGIVIARPEVNQFRETLRKQRSGGRAPDFSNLLDNPQEKDFFRQHIRLYFARWLAQNEFHDEAIQQFGKIEIKKILDPATLLFYRGLMEHQLLQKDKCVKTINRLLENTDIIPRRYQVLSKLVLADIQPLESDSLDEISRMMGDIKRRTGLYRSGKLVLEKEAEVIKKLDKLIEDLESQQKAMEMASNTTPSNPMDDSKRAGGKGSGETKNKRQTDGGDWGDLPPAQRAAALAEMAKDMPPHYRAVIEEYFRQLAKEK